MIEPTEQIDLTAPPPSELPELIKAKLRPPLATGVDGDARKSLATAAASLRAMATSAKNALQRQLPGPPAGIMTAVQSRLAAVLARRPAGLLPSGFAMPQLPAGLRDKLLAHGRRAGLQIGTALDTVVRKTPPVPESRVSEPGVPGNNMAATVPFNDHAEPDITTMAARRAVKQPSIFAPSQIMTALLAGGIIHITTTFAITALGSGSAYRQLRSVLPANQLVVFPALTPATQILPFLAPDMLYAICRFDLSVGPVVVTATLPGTGWSLALYTREGDNFYAAPGLQERPVPVAVLVQPATDRLINLTPGGRRAERETNEITSPDSEGLMVIRAPVKGIAFEASALAELKRATCGPVKR